MIDDALLSRAVARGILTRAQVEARDRLAREESEPERLENDERRRGLPMRLRGLPIRLAALLPHPIGAR